MKTQQLRLALSFIFSFTSIWWSVPLSSSMAAVPLSLNKLNRLNKIYVIGPASMTMTTSVNSFLVPTSQNDPVHQLNLSYIHYLSNLEQSELKTSPDDFVPTNMAASNSESHVAQQILGHSLSRYLDSRKAAGDTLGRTLKFVEQPLGDKLTLQDSSGVRHRVNLHFHGYGAVLAYSGLVKASLGYQMGSKSLDLELSHKISEGRKFVFNHVHESSDRRDTIGYLIEW